MAVPAAVEAASGDLARGRFDGGDTAEVGPGGFGAEPFGVVTRGDQQQRGGVDADAEHAQQTGGDLGDQVGHELVEGGLLGVEDQHPLTEGSQRDLGGVDHRVAAGTWPQRGGDRRDPSSGQARQLVSQVVGGGEAEVTGLLDGLDPRRPGRALRYHQTPGSLPRCRHETWPGPRPGPPQQRGPPRWHRGGRTCRSVDGPGGSVDRPRPPRPRTGAGGGPARPHESQCPLPRRGSPFRSWPASPAARRDRPGWSGTTRRPGARRSGPTLRPRSRRGGCPPRPSPRGLYDGLRHPFFSQGQGVARTYCTARRERSTCSTGRSATPPNGECREPGPVCANRPGPRNPTLRAAHHHVVDLTQILPPCRLGAGDRGSRSSTRWSRPVGRRSALTVRVGSAGEPPNGDLSRLARGATIRRGRRTRGPARVRRTERGRLGESVRDRLSRAAVAGLPAPPRGVGGSARRADRLDYYPTVPRD